ncbi:hypothetical protein Taro_014928, partial [Colocasia esculenta]|nr:hypothetical protein [Colocasia esculenta]
MRDRVGTAKKRRWGRCSWEDGSVGKTVAVKPSRLGFAPNPSRVPSAAEEEEEQRQLFSNAKYYVLFFQIRGLQVFKEVWAIPNLNGLQ